jgi:hypothetical protein
MYNCEPVGAFATQHISFLHPVFKSTSYVAALPKMRSIMVVKLMRLTKNELELMMNWRMRKDISSKMETSVNLTLEKQLVWFEKLMNDKSQIRWVIFCDDIPVGSMYLSDIDYINRRCEMGMFVAEKKFRSLILAKDLYWNMFEYVFEILNLNRIYGYAMDNNVHVLSLAVRVCGMNNEGTFKQHICKDGVFHDLTVVGFTKSNWHEKKPSLKYEAFYIE